MNKKELEKHWSDQTAKHAGPPPPEPESSDPRKQKIWRKPEDVPSNAAVPTKRENKQVGDDDFTHICKEISPPSIAKA
jgi:hypothetical protein